MNSQIRPEPDVLIVGGGPAGLSAAILLGMRGVDVLLVERHPAASKLPRAHLLNQRTMEIFTEMGMADEVYALSPPVDLAAFISTVLLLPAGVHLDVDVAGARDVPAGEDRLELDDSVGVGDLVAAQVGVVVGGVTLLALGGDKAAGTGGGVAGVAPGVAVLTARAATGRGLWELTTSPAARRTLPSGPPATRTPGWLPRDGSVTPP